MANKKRIFVLQPFGREFDSVYSLIQSAVNSVPENAEVFRVDEIVSPRSIVETIYASIKAADLIICDLSKSNPNVTYELGYAHALGKPVIILAQSSADVPFDVKGVRALIYDAERGHSNFIHDLQRIIIQALENPDEFDDLPKPQPAINKVFISYSHNDADFLKRLMVHLRPLEKQGLIDL